MNNYDLHCHSNVSDGILDPSQLISRAVDRGIQQLALTDHDSVSGLGPARREIIVKQHNIELINGVEISAASEFGEIHVVGINIDPENKLLGQKLDQQRLARWERAEKIASKLEKCNISGVLENLREQVKEVVTRTHIARVLVEMQVVDSEQQAFKKYLGKKGRAKVSQDWLAMDEVINLILNAGGIPILAHPTRYAVSNRKLSLLIEAFAQEGGMAIEVSYPSINKDKQQWLLLQREKHKLLVSAGSDFHYPDLKWTDLGRFPLVPSALPHVKQAL